VTTQAAAASEEKSDRRMYVLLTKYRMHTANPAAVTYFKKVQFFLKRCTQRPKLKEKLLEIKCQD